MCPCPCTRDVARVSGNGKKITSRRRVGLLAFRNSSHIPSAWMTQSCTGNHSVIVVENNYNAATENVDFLSINRRNTCLLFSIAIICFCQIFVFYFYLILKTFNQHFKNPVTCDISINSVENTVQDC